ncbi:MAG: hypothetical protein JWO05_1234 [Gemmatimonadetes bacterium]|nr:hypothetical protein [Gemmatimonadota bacterium]
MSATATPETTTLWQVDGAHTHVEFAVKHLMIATVKGRFADVAGTVTVGGDEAKSAVIDVTISAASIDTRSEQRDAHLRSGDFFDVEKYPSLRFTSNAVTPAGEGKYKLTGELTIRDVTRTVTLDVTDEGRSRDPWGNDKAGFSATTKINRADYGLTWNASLETGGVLVSDEIRISIDLELTRAQA